MDEENIVILDQVPVTERSKVSLKVRKGEQILIKGRPGSGKTTLLKIVVGLVEPDAGKVILFGEDIRHLPQFQLLRLRRNLTYLGYPLGLLENWTVYQNITLPLKYHWQLGDRECEQRIQKLETYLGPVQNLFHYQVAQLSDEKQKQITIFRGLAMHPKLVLFDLDEMQIIQAGLIGQFVQYIIDHKITAILTDSSKHRLESMGKFITTTLNRAGGES